MRPPANSLDVFALPEHGGDLAAAERRFGHPEQGWLDLSTGINPYAFPLPLIDAACWRRLPEAQAEDALRQAAAEAYGVVDVEQIVAVPGTQAIIQLLPRFRPFSQVAVVGPTYGEHVNSWTNAGHQVVSCETLDRIGDADVVVVVNPNNPDGRHHEPLRLLEIAEALSKRGGLLVVDEAFGDVAPELSLASSVGPGLVVLRSFGKFFGLAGIRLGFVIAAKPMARQLRQILGPWSVSGPALVVGRIALSDMGWAEATRHRLASDAAQLDNMLIQANLSVIGGTSLFRLVNAPRAWSLYEFLGQKGILVRPFAASPRWLRVGLPGNEHDRRRLKDALSEWGG